MPAKQAPIVYEFGEFQLDAGRRLLRTRKGEPIALTVKVFDTLLYLVEHRGELVDKAELLDAIWPNVVVEENNLNQNISVLRRALGESAAKQRFILTVPGRGFRFVAPVEVFSELPPNIPAPIAVPAAVEPLARVVRRRWWIAAAAGAALLATGAWFYYGRSASASLLPSVDASQRESQRKPRIAILPFENLSPDQSIAFFADGLHEEILSTLARRAPGLEVISRTTMMRYRQAPASVQQLAQELSADYVIEGTVRREAERVRMTLQLIDAHSDRHLWSQNYDRTLSSALTLQSDVAAEVATQLSVRFVGGADLSAPPTRSPEAYDLYLRALALRQFVPRFGTAERFAEVEKLLDRAIELDPAFVLAIAQRASFRAAIFSFNFDTSDELVGRMRDDLTVARRLAPANPDVLAAEASYLLWVERDLPRALASFEAAEAAGLGDPLLLSSKANLLSRMGDSEASIRLTNRILSLDPANPFLLGVSGTTLILDGRLADGLRVIDRGCALYPDDLGLKLLRAYDLLQHGQHRGMACGARPGQHRGPDALAHRSALSAAGL